MKPYYGTKLVLAEPVSADEMHRDDGYRVRYSDGYESWLPRKAFEDAYRENGKMNFGHALEALKQGLPVNREGWNGKGMYLLLQVPDEHSKMTLPYIYMKTAQGDLVPWLASQTDMLAEDWSAG